VNVIRKVLAGLIGILVLLLITVEFLPGRFLGQKLGALLTKVVPVDVAITRADISVFNLTPRIVLSDITVTNEYSELLTLKKLLILSRFSAVWRGSTAVSQVELSDGTVNISLDKAGNLNWPLNKFTSKSEKQTEDEVKEDISLFSVELINIENISVNYDDKLNKIEGRAKINGQGSTIEDGVNTRISASGSVNEVPVRLDVVAGPIANTTALGSDNPVTANLSVGKISAKLNGSVAFLFNPMEAPQLDFELTGDDLSDIEKISELVLPVIPPFSLTGNVLHESPFVILRRFDAQFGDSTFEGDVRLNPSSVPLEIYANIISTELDLDDFGGLIGAPSDTSETVSSAQQQLAREAKQISTVLPDRPIGLKGLSKGVNGAIDFQALNVSGEAVPVDTINMRADLSGDLIEIDITDLGLADGRVSGTALVDTRSGVPDTTLDLKLTRIQLSKLMDSLGLSNDALGTIGGELKLWARGDDVASMASSLDGGIFAAMTGGKVDALLIEIAGIDLAESLVLLATEEQETTAISCAYMDIQIENGNAVLNRFVVDTSDTVFLAEGQVNLLTEQLDLAIEPQPKDTSLLSIQTAVNVGGTLRSPQVLPDKELPLRIASAAILGSIAAPLTALIPLLEPGTGEDSAYCDGLINTLNEAR